MAIVNTPIGPNSFQFDYSTETTVEEIMAGLHAEIIREDSIEVPVLDEDGKPTYDGTGLPLTKTESHPVLDENGDPTYERGDPITELVEQPVLDGEGNPTYEQGAQIFEDGEVPVLDGEGNPTYAQGEQIFDENEDPVLDGEGNPTYEQGEQIFETVSKPVLDENGDPTYEQGDPITEMVEQPVLDGEGNPTYEQGEQIFEDVEVPVLDEDGETVLDGTGEMIMETKFTSVHGWELWDDEAGINSKCYRALNKDGITYKYVVLDLSANSSLKLIVYEDWNKTTHTGSNLCNLSNIQTYGGKVTDTQPGQIFLFVNPRWLAITTRDPFNGALNSDQTKQGIFGCFEFTRDNTEDTGEDGLPCFLWLNTAMLFQGDACAYSPRFKAGTSGANAKLELSTILGKTVTTGTKFQHFVPATKNPWNQKDWALTLYVHEPNFCVRGRIFGLKATTHNAYLILDRIITKCDLDYMYDADGVDTEHHIVHCSTHATNATSLEGRVIVPV